VATFPFNKVSGFQSWAEMMVNDVAQRLLCPLYISDISFTMQVFIKMSDTSTEQHSAKIKRSIGSLFFWPNEMASDRISFTN
jgi:hypothetical protein